VNGPGLAGRRVSKGSLEQIDIVAIPPALAGIPLQDAIMIRVGPRIRRRDGGLSGPQAKPDVTRNIALMKQWAKEGK
jgi:hypothetical protein